ncbi:MAG: type II toxin-antitoxin system VapC family toxin [Thiotrichaceae bacterium]|nr:type II toxin-antitoxin system VapC family toxin [Thiotrichaceae bacterium]MBL1260535.1 type II toxin-antitoxin system VapC family toxin [Thiotrichaceae bacterium]
MYLIDTNVLSEVRKKKSVNKGVLKFFELAVKEENKLYLSVITIGELRRGVELIRHRGDTHQANQLEKWLGIILSEYSDYILELDEDIAQLWGKLRSPHHEHAIDKQIAATAMIHGLTVVTRNTKDFLKTGTKVLNPFD